MSQLFHTPEEMNQYLLGSLTEAETERLDELSVTDAAFADALAAAETDLIDAYVQGELSGAVLRQFESCYLAPSNRRGRVEFAQAFQVMAQKHQAAETAAETPAEPSTRRKAGISFAGIFRFPRLTPQWTFAAAAFALLLVGGWLLFENTRASRPEPRIASFVLTPQTRDAAQVRTLAIPAGTEQVAMTMELEPNDYAAYRVELLNPADNRTLWRSDQLIARITKNGRDLRISLPPRLLKPQTYLLRVTGVSANGGSEVVGDYPFKL